VQEILGKVIQGSLLKESISGTDLSILTQVKAVESIHCPRNEHFTSAFSKIFQAYIGLAASNDVGLFPDVKGDVSRRFVPMTSRWRRFQFEIHPRLAYDALVAPVPARDSTPS
jgi:hypothetical protein